MAALKRRMVKTTSGGATGLVRPTTERLRGGLLRPRSGSQRKAAKARMPKPSAGEDAARSRRRCRSSTPARRRTRCSARSRARSRSPRCCGRRSRPAGRSSGPWPQRGVVRVLAVLGQEAAHLRVGLAAGRLERVDAHVAGEALRAVAGRDQLAGDAARRQRREDGLPRLACFASSRIPAGVMSAEPTICSRLTLVRTSLRPLHADHERRDAEGEHDDRGRRSRRTRTVSSRLLRLGRAEPILTARGPQARLLGDGRAAARAARIGPGRSAAARARRSSAVPAPRRAARWSRSTTSAT